MARLTDDDREDLTAYLDGEADPEVCARVEARLNSDPNWRAEADALKKAWDMLDHLPQTSPSPQFTSQTLTRLSELRSSASTTLALPPVSRWPWKMFVSALIGVVVGWLAMDTVLARREQPIDWDDPRWLSDLQLIESLPLYHAAESLEFLQSLDHPDRFGVDSLGPR